MNNQNRELTDKDERVAKKLKQKLTLEVKSEWTINGVVAETLAESQPSRDTRCKPEELSEDQLINIKMKTVL